MRAIFAGVMLLGVGLLAAQTGVKWQSSFPVDRKMMGVAGSNPSFPLTPGQQWSYRHGKDTETVTVLDKTRMIDGIESRAVEDRELVGGQLEELTIDYYAIDRGTNDVYYMGEEVDEYKNGKVSGHDGAWLSGVNGATFGMMLPGSPKVGQRFYQEQGPGAKDRIEIKSTSEKVVTPAGTFDHSILVEESSELEKGVSHKWYVSGIGPVKDDAMELVSHK